jgi:hypothetical protein
VVQEPLAIAEIVAYAPLDEPVEPSSEADWIALTPRSAATVTPPAHTPSVPEEVPSLDTSTSPHTTPPPAVTAPTPRLSVDEIIARAFGRRPAPELPTVEPGPAPERVSRALIAERLAHGAYASAPALDDIAEIEIDRAGTVTVRRGPAERLPAYLPAMAGVHAVVGFLGEQIVVHDLLRVDDRDLRGEPLWRRYVTAMECSSVAGIPVVPLLPHPRPVDAAERISVRDLRAPYGRSGSWISAD